MNKLLQTSLNRSLNIQIRCIEEGTLAVKVACTVGMVHPGRSYLSGE